MRDTGSRKERGISEKKKINTYKLLLSFPNYSHSERNVTQESGGNVKLCSAGSPLLSLPMPLHLRPLSLYLSNKLEKKKKKSVLALILLSFFSSSLVSSTLPSCGSYLKRKQNKAIKCKCGCITNILTQNCLINMIFYIVYNSHCVFLFNPIILFYFDFFCGGSIYKFLNKQLYIAVSFFLYFICIFPRICRLYYFVK